MERAWTTSGEQERLASQNRPLIHPSTDEIGTLTLPVDSVARTPDDWQCRFANRAVNNGIDLI